MVSLTRLLVLATSIWSFGVSAAALTGKPQNLIQPYKREPLQDIVSAVFQHCSLC